LISRIGPGIVALIGIGVEDTADEVAPLSQKILTTKLWNEGQKASQINVPPQYTNELSSNEAIDTTAKPTDEGNDEQKTRSEQVWGGKPWKQNVIDLEGEVMCISQFTLHARLSKGTKPDFHKSMGGEQAKILYEQLLERLGKGYRSDRIKGR
jgi:D-aminoacyl-tRNA deacylase